MQFVIHLVILLSLLPAIIPMEALTLLLVMMEGKPLTFIPDLMWHIH